MLTEKTIKKFKEKGYSFEEVSRIIESLEEFKKTGKTYSTKEVLEKLEIDNLELKIFSKKNIECTV